MTEMTNTQELVRLAVDKHRGTVQKYSNAQADKLLHEALVEMCGGSTKLDLKKCIRGQYVEAFAFIEEVLAQTVYTGLEENDFYNEFVDRRNLALGDEAHFVVENEVVFTVDDVAEGNQAIRRQRFEGRDEYTVKTSLKAIRIYEELNRVLAGRVDFNDLINAVAKAMNQKILNDIYTLWYGVTQAQLGGTKFFPNAGAYNEATLLTLIENVEAAANGAPATIVGTKTALRKLVEGVTADSAKESMHNFGYFGKFNGTPMVCLPQKYKAGTTTFVYPNDEITVVAGSDKPIKFVYEGDPIVNYGNPFDNMDLTQEYFYADRYGLALVMSGNSGLGKYKITA